VAVGESVWLLPLDRAARVRSIEVHGQRAERAVPGRRTALALVGVDKDELARGHVAVTGTGWMATTALDAAVELLPAARKPIAGRTRLRVHLGTAEVLARAVQGRPIAPGERGLVRLLLEAPLVARGGDRFVLRSFSPVTTIGGGVVLDPTPHSSPVLSRRRLGLEQPPAERLAAWAHEADLAGLAVAGLAVRLGVLSGGVTAVIDAAGDALVTCGEYVVARAAVAAAVARLGEVLRRYHKEHPLDPGMSLQALRAAVAVQGEPAAAVVDHVLAVGGAAEGRGSRGRQAWELVGSVVRVPGWRPAFDTRATAARERLLRRLTDAEWQIPTVRELERELAGEPVQALLAHLVREGMIEQLDQERFATKHALESFRAALEVALQDLGAATPALLRDRLGLTRKFLIPLLEWADRRSITRRAGDARTLARLTAR
jgi:selenocysteine-specific elongation factor